MLDSENAELLWFLVGLAFVLMELIMPGFVVIFFGVGAWIVAIGIWAGILESFTSQLFVFLVASLLSLVLFRKQGKKYFEGKVTGRLLKDQEVDDVKGEKAIVVASITPNAVGGKVEFHGTMWEAESDVPIEKGKVVEIVGRVNLVLKVKPVQ
jgi:inner membrane protein